MKFTDYPIRGVDTSEFNGAVNMATLKTTGALFNIMRAGYGKTIDQKFKVNWANCKGVMLRSAYWYLDYYSNWYNPNSSAYGMTDFDWGKLQAQNLWAVIKDDNDNQISWLDIESGGSSYSPAITTVWARVDQMIDGFLTELDRLSGKVNGIYCSLGLLNSFALKYKTRPLWVAWYNEYQTPESVFKNCNTTKGWALPVIWQYASHGDVNGDGVADGLTYGTGIVQLDLNIWLRSAADWASISTIPPVETDILLSVQPMSQNNPLWANDQLGISSSTIGGFGCVVTSAAMMLKYLGFDTDPGRLNTWLTNNSGYLNGNLFVWNSLNRLYPKVTFLYRYDGAPLDKIDESLAKRIPVIVNVDYLPSTAYIDQHWVIIVGKKNGLYIIIDPRNGQQTTLNEIYGSPETGIYHVCTYAFSGIPAFTDAEKLAKLWLAHPELHI